LVYAIGRDADSGTRLTAFAETGIGVFSGVTQWQPTNASGHVIDRTGAGAGPVVGQQLWPAQTINNIFYDVGQGGYASGGDLAQAMKTSQTNITLRYVTYLGISDATSAISGGASEITYNGVTYSDAAVQEGQYTFWGYEHLDYRNNYGTVDANGKAGADQLALRIKNFDATLAGELLSTMHSTRPTDGGLVTPNF